MTNAHVIVYKYRRNLHVSTFIDGNFRLKNIIDHVNENEVEPPYNENLLDQFFVCCGDVSARCP